MPNSGTNCLASFRLIIGTDAYSGATVTALDRVPVWLSRSIELQDLLLDYIIFKEQLIISLSHFAVVINQKIKKLIKQCLFCKFSLPVEAGLINAGYSNS